MAPCPSPSPVLSSPACSRLSLRSWQKPRRPQRLLCSKCWESVFQALISVCHKSVDLETAAIVVNRFPLRWSDFWGSQRTHSFLPSSFLFDLFRVRFWRLGHSKASVYKREIESHPARETMQAQKRPQKTLKRYIANEILSVIKNLTKPWSWRLHLWILQAFKTRTNRTPHWFCNWTGKLLGCFLWS